MLVYGMCVCMHMSMSACVHACVRVCVGVCVFVRVCACLCVCADVQAFACLCSVVRVSLCLSERPSVRVFVCACVSQHARVHVYLLSDRTWSDMLYDMPCSSGRAPLVILCAHRFHTSSKRKSMLCCWAFRRPNRQKAWSVLLPYPSTTFSMGSRMEC